MLSIDLNCDLGESTDNGAYNIEKDLSLLAYTSSINLACGFHAGDASTMHTIVQEALQRDIGIGAHPSYPDRAHFGRTEMLMPPRAIYDIILYQLGALQAFLEVHQATLQHVKPHGALYNTAARNRAVADAIVHAVRDYDNSLLVFGLSGSELIDAARAVGLSAVSEVFADRTYQADGSLTPRRAADALIDDASVSARQVIQMVANQTVTTVNGTSIPVEAGTVCLHGDGAHAVALAETICEALHARGVAVRKPKKSLP